ncbi:MAG TPA: hypothetical protein PLV45_15405 [bacterium]|nr:hypothetical protein [bacterium]
MKHRIFATVLLFIVWIQPAAAAPGLPLPHSPRIVTDALTGKTLPDLELVDFQPPYGTVRLHQWIDLENKPVVLAFLDGNLPDHHVQVTPLERLARSTYRKILSIGIVNIHKRPEAYARFLGPARSSRCRLFAIRRKKLIQSLNPGPFPVIVYVSRQHRIFKCCASYCDYDILKQDVDSLLDDYRSH